VGTIELPLAVGLVGGATTVHPTAKINVKILGVKTANELAEIIAAVGLAQNFAALRTLATEGIYLERAHVLTCTERCNSSGCTGRIDRQGCGKTGERKAGKNRQGEGSAGRD